MKTFFAALLISIFGILPSAKAAPAGYILYRETPSFQFFTASSSPPRSIVQIVENAEKLFSPIAKTSGYIPDKPAEVVFVENHKEFQRLGFPKWAVGITRASQNQIVVSLRNQREFPIDLASVFVHELSHLALLRAVGEAQQNSLPRWFVEGVAIWQSKEGALLRNEELLEAARSDGLIPLRDLNDSFPKDDTLIGRSYAQSGAFVRFLAETAGEKALAKAIFRVGQGEPFGVAIRNELGKNLSEFETSFFGQLRLQASWLPVLTSSGLIWVLASLLFFWGYQKKRREKKRRLQAWEREESMLFDESEVWLHTSNDLLFHLPKDTEEENFEGNEVTRTLH